MDDFDFIFQIADVENLLVSEKKKKEENSITQVDWLEDFEERNKGTYDVGSNLLNNDRKVKDGGK